MSGRIIEIGTPGRSVHLERGFLAIRSDGDTIGRTQLDDIDAVIAATPGLYWSGNVLAALAERSIPVVLVGRSYAPIAHILPLADHHAQGAIMQAQAESTLPMRKRLWKQIVQAKIDAQAEILELLGKPAERLRRLRSEVKSGDSTNREAAAAQYYWPHLMGPDFRRDRGADGSNSQLNYGYTILRAAAARAIVAAGLNPSLSLHHASNGQALRLADDLMEPFRPAIDICVHDLGTSGTDDLNPETKAVIAATLLADYATENGSTPLSHVLVRLAQSLAAIYAGHRTLLGLPKRMRPLIDQLALAP